MNVEDIETRVVALMAALRVTHAQAAILERLHRGKACAATKRQLMEAIYADADDEPDDTHILSVFICKLRQRFGFGEIVTLYGHGYALTPKGQARVLAALGEVGNRAA